VEGKKADLFQPATICFGDASFDFNIKQVIQAGDIALMRTEWKMSSPSRQMSVYAIEVARSQPDGSTWRWLIGNPFTVGRNAGF
jgi:ketosteroid isomerase-like protein